MINYTGDCDWHCACRMPYNWRNLFDELIETGFSIVTHLTLYLIGFLVLTRCLLRRFSYFHFVLLRRKRTYFP